MPMKPMAAAAPAPSAAPGYVAALAVATGSDGRAEEGERVGLWMPEMLVELLPVGLALMDGRGVECALDGAGVGDATTG